MSQNLFEKIWQQHLIAEVGDSGLLLIDRIFLHERMGGVALRSLAAAGHRVRSPRQVFATMDHVVDTRPGRTDDSGSPTAARFIETLRHEAGAADIRLFDIDDPQQGIVHVVGPELGITLPGVTLVCPDSHTCTQGALGALAWGIGSSEAEHALATQTLRVARPKTLRITITDRLEPGVTAKDLALALIARHGAAGGKGFVIEFAGPAIETMDPEARMTLCNMAAEFSAFTAIIAPDEKTYAYLEGKPFVPTGSAFASAQAQWRALRSDPGASFDAELQIDAGTARPMITWGTNPQQAMAIDARVPGYSEVADRERRSDYDRAIEYMGVQAGTRLLGLPIDGAFIGACTNSRLADLRRAAALLAGQKVARGVRAVCVPGSSSVKRAAEAQGLHEVFRAAGFEWRESGCSMCFHAGGESFGPRQRVVSSTNRNFEGRQGPLVRSHLASPETVAASAVAGCIAAATGRSN